MTKLLVALMLCLNAALAAALIAGPATPKAYGQYAGSDYLAVTGQAGANEAVYLLDLGSRKLLVLRLGKVNNALTAKKSANVRQLQRDFGQAK